MGLASPAGNCWWPARFSSLGFSRNDWSDWNTARCSIWKRAVRASCGGCCQKAATPRRSSPAPKPANCRRRNWRATATKFDKREKDMDPVVDARLSFTTSIGYRPNGLDLPAWKDVFFHPKTDEAIIDRLLYCIEELL